MMTLYCPVCSEPCELDELHATAEETGVPFSAVRDAFYRTGCEAIGTTHGDPPGDKRMAEAARAIYDIAGDDVDAAAAFLEDAADFF